MSNHVNVVKTESRWDVFSKSGVRLGTFYDKVSLGLFVEAITALCSY